MMIKLNALRNPFLTLIKRKNDTVPFCHSLCNKYVKTAPEMLKNNGAVSPLKKPQILNQILPDDPCNLTSAINIG